jgi:DNA-binding response OmpR family regulator
MSRTRTPVVMVVEDDASMRKLLRLTLAGAGYAVLEAADARTALTLAAHEMPDLIIQDLILPDVAGLALVQELRALPNGAEVPIIALSGTQSRLDEAWRLRGGFTAYLRKPIEPSRLEEAVHAYLRPDASQADRFGDGRRVLVVDDDPAQAKLLSLQLSDWGFEPLVEVDPASALATARRERPAAIVSDVLMPEMDGFRLCLEVHAHSTLADVPVVLVSAAAPEDDDYELARRVSASALVMGTPGFWGLREALARSLAEDGAVVGVTDVTTGALRLELERRSIRLRSGAGGAADAALRAAPAIEDRLTIAALARLAMLLAHRRDAHTVLDEALSEAFVLFGGSPAAVLLRDGSGGLEHVAQHGGAPGVLAALGALARDASLFEPLAALGGPLVLDRHGAAPVVAEVLRLERAAALSITPLLAAGRRIGALVVVHGGAVPDLDAQALLQIIAGLIGPALALTG